MTSKTYDRYQDYVIKDGHFIGRFEEMYQKFDDPWHQSESAQTRFSPSRTMTVLYLNKYNIRSVLEVGSGLGAFSHLIQENTSARVTGIDISATAVEKARTTYPEIDFRIDSVDNLKTYKNLDAVLFAEVTWYVLPKMHDVFEWLLTYFRGKYFLHNLTFYSEGKQSYGREFFSTLAEFIRFCPLTLLDCTQAETSNGEGNQETSAIFRVEPKSNRAALGKFAHWKI